MTIHILDLLVYNDTQGAQYQNSKFLKTKATTMQSINKFHTNKKELENVDGFELIMFI